MSIDNNDGLFDKIKKAVDAGYTIDPIGQEYQEEDPAALSKSQVERENSIERELLSRLSQEKHRLAAEMEMQSKRDNIARMKAHEQKFKELLAQEKLEYQKTLKEKYERLIKTVLQDREKKLVEKYKQKTYLTEVELRQKISQLEQELEQQKRNADLYINEARISARQEQEQASKNMYDNLLQSSRSEIVKQTEDKCQAEFLQKEIQLKRSYEQELSDQSRALLAEYEAKLRAVSSEHEAKLRSALIEQEHTLTQEHREQLSKQSELFNLRLEQEIANAVSAASTKLEMEFVKEKQALNAAIEELRPEVERNKVRMRMEVEQEVRKEFEAKYAEYKRQVDAEKVSEMETLLTMEKQKLAENLQAENLVVLKYKEREIRDACTADFNQQMQDKLQQALVEQEQRLRAEMQQHVDHVTGKLQAEHALQLQAQLIQERAKIEEKNTHEKKILLQQQQTSLQEKYEAELAHKLAVQAQDLSRRYKLDSQELEAKLLQNERMQRQKQTAETTVNDSQSNLGNALIVPKSYLEEKQANDSGIREALLAQKEELEARFAQQLRDARREWEKETKQDVLHSRQEIESACESRLRREFQAILLEQRKQAAEKFTKQRDQEVRTAINKYKQKLLDEMETVRVNELAASEEALKEQYAARIQQHSELARVEIERAKEQLHAEQQEKIRQAVEQQVAAVRKEHELKLITYAKEQEKKLARLIEEERKQINLKFAQDKANLVKDLTARFNREKHAAMAKYETELRDKLYKEMVKQKDYIQTKFSSSQAAALQEQKRRLEAQHKQEIERIRQGYFDPAATAEYAKHDQIIVERNVEKLADNILAKFQRETKE